MTGGFISQNHSPAVNAIVMLCRSCPQRRPSSSPSPSAATSFALVAVYPFLLHLPPFVDSFVCQPKPSKLPVRNWYGTDLTLVNPKRTNEEPKRNVKQKHNIISNNLCMCYAARKTLHQTRSERRRMDGWLNAASPWLDFLSGYVQMIHTHTHTHLVYLNIFMTHFSFCLAFVVVLVVVVVIITGVWDI